MILMPLELFLCQLDQDQHQINRTCSITKMEGNILAKPVLDKCQPVISVKFAQHHQLLCKF